MSAHTPGPWTANFVKGVGHVVEADGFYVARVEGDAGDARLIAAAPRMLNVLKHLDARPDLLTDPMYQDQIRELLREVEAQS